MPIANHRILHPAATLLVSSIALLPLPLPAHAAWGIDPIQVHPTTANCPLVCANDDAALGAIILWQEETASGGLLRAQHLLPGGDVDPAWAGPVMVCDRDAPRVALGSVSDGAGGGYVWWMEGAQLYLTRITAQGSIAGGWPAGGRTMGPLVDVASRPVVCSDGGGGVYAAWLSANVAPAWIVIRAHHLGPSGTAKDGWPSGGRTLANTVALGEHASAFGIATARDGGLWLAYATTVSPNLDVYEPGEVRVTHLTGGGTPAAGWSATGVTLAPFRGELLAMSDSYWGLAPPMRLAAVASDGDGGAFVLFGDVYDSGGAAVRYRLQRVDGSGAIAPGWPAGGIGVPPSGLDASEGQAATTSLALHADLSGGVFAGRPSFYDHGVDYDFKHLSASGANLGYGPGGGITGLETAARGDGGIVVASYFPEGPYGPNAPPAYLQLSQSDPGATFSEYHPEPVIEWYGDIGLAATGDGGSILAWSQVNERYGIFAIRMNPGSIVTGVTPTPIVGPPSLRVRFVRGSGVHAVASFSAAQRVSLGLYDLAGRSVASLTSDATLGADVVLPGTRDLPGGVYFVRANDARRALNARVIVLP